MADAIRVANQLTLKEGDHPGLSGWSGVMTRLPKSGKRGQKETIRKKSGYGSRIRDALRLALKMEREGREPQHAGGLEF